MIAQNSPTKETPEQGRFVVYGDAYAEGLRAVPVPDPMDPLSGNPASGGNRAIQSKKTKYGEGTMSPEAMAAAKNKGKTND